MNPSLRRDLETLPASRSYFWSPVCQIEEKACDARGRSYPMP